MGLSSPKIKKLLFNENYCFFRCFHFSPLIVFTVFFGVFIVNWIFYVTNFAAFLSGTLFLCCCTASVTDLRELFLHSGVFYLKLLPDIWHSPLLSRLPWG